MNFFRSRFVWGILLILAGILFLFQNIFLPEEGDLIWAFILSIGAVYFLGLYLSNRSAWWALLPGVILTSLVVTILVSLFAGDAGDDWGGTIFLGGIGLAFLLVYLVGRFNWWAIIPAGVLFTLAVSSSPLIEDSGADGAIFFLGLGITFTILGMLPAGEGNIRQRWAFIPGVALLAVGAVIAAAATDLAGYIWPIALIVGGGALLYQTLTGKRA